MEDSNKKSGNAVSKDDAFGILDRTIGFINSCDNKTSIILGTLSVIFAIILTSDGVLLIRRILSAALGIETFGIIYIVLFVFFILVLGFGLAKFISVLIARTDSKKIKVNFVKDRSVIFFKRIVDRQPYEKFRNELISLTETGLMEDIISEIYANAAICNLKFKRYNSGIRYSLVGFVGWMILLVIGSFVFIA